MPLDITELQKDALKLTMLAVSQSEEWRQATLAADAAYRDFAPHLTDESAYHEACSTALQMSLDWYELIAYCHALQAYVVKDRITPEEFLTLVTPWESVMGSTLLEVSN